MPVSTPLTRRRFLAGTGLATAAALSGSALAACGNAVAGGSGTTALQLWIDITGAPNEKYFTAHVVDTFQKAYPHIALKTTFYQGQDLRRIIQTALQARSGPDIVRGASASLTLAWSKAHTLKELSGYADKYDWKNKISSWALKPFTIDSKIYALPMRTDTMLLYYNKSLFAKKNWKPPTNRAELESLAEEAHGQGIVPFGATNVDWAAASEWLMTVFWNHYAGPDAIYQALTGKVPWTDPIFVEAVELIQGYFNKGWMGGSTQKYYSVPSATMGAQFGAGTVAMFPQGEWWMPAVGQFFGAAAHNDNEWDWAPLPALHPGIAYPLYEIGIGGSLGISAYSPAADQAAEFLNWYYGNTKQALERMAAVPGTYNIPIPFTPAEVPSSIDPRSLRLLTATQQAMATGNFGYVTWTWWPPKSDVFVYEGLDQVLTGKLTPKEYCAQLNQTFRQEMQAGTIPPTLAPGHYQAA
jgi:raffinose/stachyose/melibiose transport system substrate-binding protein